LTEFTTLKRLNGFLVIDIQPFQSVFGNTLQAIMLHQVAFTKKRTLRFALTVTV
jgi:hypothetical protein